MNESLPWSVEQLLEPICVRFERAWQAGEKPAIEPYLAEVGAELRSALLVELVALDLTYRRRGGARPTVADYAPRFPEMMTHIEAVFADVADPNATVVTTPGGGRVREESQRGERYQTIRLHGKGGQGEVYLAQDRELGRQVAVKRLQANYVHNPECRRRFVREARVTSQLDHPGVVPVFDQIQDEQGQPSYAMRFVEGETMGAAIARYHGLKDNEERKRALRELLGRFVAVCNTMAYAHSKGVLHRDLKPANVMLGKYGETLVVDWGLAKMEGLEEPTGEVVEQGDGLPGVSGSVAGTRSGLVLGTPNYVSPEQAAGRWDEVGPASDVFGLGAILYEVLTNRRPYEGGDGYEVLKQAERGEIVPPGQKARGVPRALEAVCVKAMAFRPGERYTGARELAEDVERWLADEPVSTYRGTVAERVGRWARRRRTVVVAAAVAMGVALVGLTVGLVIVGGLNWRLESANESLKTAQTVAEERRKEAEKDRNVAVAVNDLLLKDLLGQADVRNQPFLGETSERNPKITVVELLERASRSVGGKFADQPETEAAIRMTMGNAFLVLDHAKLAQLHLDRALSLRLRLLGPDHPYTLGSKHDLAGLYLHQEEYDKAESLFREVIQQREKQLGSEHPDTLTAKHSLAVTYASQGKDDLAEPLYLDVLNRREKQLGADHIATLSTKHNLAALYRHQGKYDKAEPLYAEVFGRHEQQLGADHLSTLKSKKNLAYLYELQGKYDKAEPLFLEVLSQREKQLGADHSDTSSSKNDLAGLYRQQAKYDKAVSLLLEVVKHFEIKFGADHSDTLTVKNNLAGLYELQGKYDKAEPMYLDVLLRRAKKFGEEHSDTLIVKNNLAGLYQRLRKFDQAEPLFLEVLQRRQKKLGALHPFTLATKHQLAVLYRHQGKHDKAEPLYLEVLRHRERQLGADHPDTLASKNDLAVLYESQKKYDQAEPLYLAVLEQFDNMFGADHPNTLACKNNLAALYSNQGKYDKAEPLYQQAFVGAKGKLGFPHPRTQAFFGNLLHLYLQWGKPQKAEPLLRERLDFIRKQSGADSPATAAALTDLALNLLNQKKYVEAENPLRDNLRIRGKTQPDHWTTSNTRSVLGDVLLSQHKHTDAEPLLLQGYEGLVKHAAAIPAQTRPLRIQQALERLVRLYEATDRKDEAAKWRTKLAEAKAPPKP